MTTHKESKPQRTIHVCMSAGCLAAHSREVKQALEDTIEQHDLKSLYSVRGVGCIGLCQAAPAVMVNPDGTLYQHVTPEGVSDVIEDIGAAQPIDSLPFFNRQTRIVLENAGRIDPRRIEDYVEAGGYSALAKALTSMTPTEIIEEVSRSGLRGRGGAGYSTGLKWKTVAKAHRPDDSRKFIVCNADEGDPGTFVDRSIMESDPHRVLEGMAIAAYALGAHEGYIYVRAEYPLAIEHLRIAIQQAEEAGYLGDKMLDSPFSFHINLRMGAGAYVCGEETALLASIEGKRGTPRPRPPYPAESGLWGCPTLINNVETFANISPIIRNGASWYASIGTEKSKGTKLFSLTGQINNVGLIEVPMGITLREIIFDIGGGIPNGRKFKAVQTGGPTGGCLPEAHLDTPVDYESLNRLGSLMGSGGMIILDETSCMVDVARFFMDFCRSESCGKCVPCRVGTTHMYHLLDKITHGEATLDDLALLEELCDLTKNTSLCGLGQSAPNPVLSTLRYFRDEYIAHIVEKRCPAGVCHLENALEVVL